MWEKLLKNGILYILMYLEMCKLSDEASSKSGCLWLPLGKRTKAQGAIGRGAKKLCTEYLFVLHEFCTRNTYIPISLRNFSRWLADE